MPSSLALSPNDTQNTEQDKTRAAQAPRQDFLYRIARDSVYRQKFLAVLSIVMGLVAWEVAGRWIVNPLFLPPLSGIWTRFVELAAGGQLGRDIWASSQEYLLGLLLAIVVGGGIGIAMAASKVLRDLFDPWVAVLNATPII